MPQFQYTLLWFDRNDWDSMHAHLNTLGAQGWQMTGVMGDAIIMMRETPKTIPAMWDETKGE